MSFNLKQRVMDEKENWNTISILEVYNKATEFLLQPPYPDNSKNVCQKCLKEFIRNRGNFAVDENIFVKTVFASHFEPIFNNFLEIVYFFLFRNGSKHPVEGLITRITRFYLYCRSFMAYKEEWEKNVSDMQKKIYGPTIEEIAKEVVLDFNTEPESKIMETKVMKKIVQEYSPIIFIQILNLFFCHDTPSIFMHQRQFFRMLEKIVMEGDYILNIEIEEIEKNNSVLN